MRDSGLFAFCGVPGSGKTLNCVRIALKHYKKENNLIKYYVAYFKYLCTSNKFFKMCIDILNKYNFVNIIKTKYNNWCLKQNITFVKLSQVFFKLLKYFFKFIILLYIFVCRSWTVKIILFILIFYTKSIIKWFNNLDYLYICTFPHKKINNIYSTFPILLDKKRNIYSHKCTLWDLQNLCSFYPNSIIIIDEIQLFVDSDEYKDKFVTELLRKIGNYFQAHRHFGIKNILVTSQGVTRIFKKCRDVCSGYLKLNRVFKIPFCPFGFISGTMYYDIDFFGKFIPRHKEERRKLPFDYKKIRCFVNMNKIYSAYDSRYLANMNYDKPLLNRGEYESLRTSSSDLSNLFVSPENNDKKKENKRESERVDTKKSTAFSWPRSDC